MVAAELAAAMEEVAAALDAVHATAVEFEALRGSSINSSVSAGGSTNVELRLAREAMRERAAQWAEAHPCGALWQ